MIVPRDRLGQWNLWRQLNQVFGSNSSSPEPTPCPTCPPRPTVGPCPTCAPCPACCVRALYWRNMDDLKLEEAVKREFDLVRPDFPEIEGLDPDSWWFRLDAWDVEFVLQLESEPSEWPLAYGCFIENNVHSGGRWEIFKPLGFRVEMVIRVFVDDVGSVNVCCSVGQETRVSYMTPAEYTTGVWLSLPIFGSPDWLAFRNVQWEMTYREGSSSVVYKTG